MNDMSAVITPKSDQINADDLIAGPQTITIRDVQIRGGQEQPVSIYFDGSDKAFRPCKSMSRVLVQAWGPDARNYIGRTVTLYRDPSVKWGGMEVGGIRISHMSHIEGKMQMALTATKGQRKPFVVMPLIVENPPKGKQSAEEWAAEHMAAIAAVQTADKLDALTTEAARAMAKLLISNATTHGILMDAYNARRAELTGEGKPDEERGKAFVDADDVGF